jgi:hypothetical protein
VFYHNTGGPADISYNSRDDILAIPLMSVNFYALLPVTAPAEVPEGTRPPGKPSLGRNCPNPFGAGTNIEFSVPEDAAEPTILQIYDVEGRLVRTLLEGMMPPGTHLSAWDARSDKGRKVAPGLYLCQLSQGPRSATMKMTLLP